MDLTQIPKLGNRPGPRRRARPSIYWLLRREKSRSSGQLFCSVCVTVRILEDDDFPTSEFRLKIRFSERSVRVRVPPSAPRAGLSVEVINKGQGI
jgi:hypothetical protein